MALVHMPQTVLLRDGDGPERTVDVESNMEGATGSAEALLPSEGRWERAQDSAKESGLRTSGKPVDRF